MQTTDKANKPRRFDMSRRPRVNRDPDIRTALGLDDPQSEEAPPDTMPSSPPPPPPLSPSPPAPVVRAEVAETPPVPNVQVDYTFPIGNGGQFTFPAYYHHVFISAGLVVLVFNRGYRGGVEFKPPIVRQPVEISISSTGRTQRMRVLSAGFGFEWSELGLSFTVLPIDTTPAERPSSQLDDDGLMEMTDE